jgi:hypothetical protein
MSKFLLHDCYPPGTKGPEVSTSTKQEEGEEIETATTLVPRPLQAYGNGGAFRKPVVHLLEKTRRRRHADP